MADNLLLAQFRIKVRRFVHLCPRRLKLAFGPLIGGVIGLMGGIPGLLIGLLLGYFVGELFAQFFNDRRIRDYFRNPGSQKFFETVPGLAAWCALGVLVASETPDASEPDCPTDSSALSPPEEGIIKELTLAASRVFTVLADTSAVEHFSRLACSCKEYLNSDLLTESLAAKRALPEAIPVDSEDLMMGLFSLARGKRAKDLVRQICVILDPSLDYEQRQETAYLKNNETPEDPWKILGLPSSTPLKEVKAHYRKLAKLFHPDELVSLDKQRQETAAQAFIAIQEAYKQVCGIKAAHTPQGS